MTPDKIKLRRANARHRFYIRTGLVLLFLPFAAGVLLAALGDKLLHLCGRADERMRRRFPIHKIYAD